MSSSLRQTAVHESGHAVVSWRLGLPFDHMTVEAGEDYLGRVLHEEIGDWFQPDLAYQGDENYDRIMQMIADNVAISLAGVEAETAWLRRTGQSETPHENTWAHDRGLAVDLAMYASGSRADTEAYLERSRQRALEILGRDQPIIDALAEALIERGTLTWREACAVMEEADDLQRP